MFSKWKEALDFKLKYISLTIRFISLSLSQVRAWRLVV